MIKQLVSKVMKKERVERLGCVDMKIFKNTIDQLCNALVVSKQEFHFSNKNV